MKKNLSLTRALSWLKFNARVLQEADDPSNPLKARVRFLGIYSNNRDEFFRRRMPAVRQLVESNPNVFLKPLVQNVLRQQRDFIRIWKRVNEELKKQKIFLIDDKHLNEKQKKFVVDYFTREIRLSIIPLFIENMPKWPPFGDENIFLGIAMKAKANSPGGKFAIIEIPTRNHPRFICLPSKKGEQNIILLEDVIRFNLPKIFSPLGYTYFKAHMFKVTKDAEIDIDNEPSTTFVQKIEKGLKNRRHNRPVSLLYDKEIDKKLLQFIVEKLNLNQKNLIIPGGKIRNFRDFMDFPAHFPHCRKHEPFKHWIFRNHLRVSDLIMTQDILLHFPYHSFDSIIDLLCEAAMDSDVQSIRITAYRLADKSKVCNALINAAKAGKRVSVVLELRACFDEHANLEWKKRLEEEGVHVFVGLPHMKVHAKICVIRKKTGNRIVRYGFVGTGNVNEKTAQCYTDLFLLTSNVQIMKEVDCIFDYLENPKGNADRLKLCQNLLVSPVNMRQGIIKLIDSEIGAAKEGKSARIILNVNSVSDEKLMAKLYEAAAAGVDIQLIVRGIFCMETDRKDFAKTITAVSIVDEHLEHSRIWFFHRGGEEVIYLSSADLNERNLDHRIEVAVPIQDQRNKEELKHILKIKLSDNVKARILDSELSNVYVSSPKRKPVRSQLAIYRYLRGKS